jgi:hypothetical protein
MTMKMKGRLMFAERPKRDVGSGGSHTKAELAAPRSPSAAAGPQHVVGIVDLGLGRVADPSMDGDDLLVGIQSEGQ